MAFDAFISYSHAADGELAPALQKGLQQLARPWNRRRALRVFRDDTGLAVNPGLWQSITAALDESEYFVLLASPSAADSEWVNREVAYWLESRPDAASKVLPVLTDGNWAWDKAANDIAWSDSSAAPAALAGVFAGEPRHLDLVWARSSEELDLRNTRFRDAVADLAAPIHGIPKDELEGEDVRQHRRATFLRRAAVSALVLLVFGLGVAGVLALRSADTANRALRDLEAANGSIEDLEAEGVELQAANAAAAEDLADTEAARLTAEDLAAAAEQEADEAESARAEAESAKAAAETAQTEAERLATEAEDAQAAAESARNEAESAQAAAEQDRDAAEQAAAAAADAEQAALSAEEAAREAEAQARTDEQVALDAEANAREQEAEARAAEESAQAGERLALTAEATARSAEAAARSAEEAAQSAAEEAILAEEAAVAAREVADEAAATARQAQTDAEAAALAASLARAAAEQGAPSLDALLSVESYCAVESCDDAVEAQSLVPDVGAMRRTLTAPGFVPLEQTDRSAESFVPSDLDPFLPMIESVSRHQDVLPALPDADMQAVSISLSANGRTIAAVDADGVVTVWTDGAAVDVDIGTDTVGVAVSDDGSTLAALSSRPLEINSSGSVGVEEIISYVSLDGGDVPRGGFVRSGFVGGPRSSAQLTFQPGSGGAVLIGDHSPGDQLVFDPSLIPTDFSGPVQQVIEVGSGVAAWTSDGRLAVFDQNGGDRIGLDGSSDVITSSSPAEPTAIAVGGNRIVVGYANGSLEAYGSRREGQQPEYGTVSAIAVSADGSTAVTADQSGTVRRVRLETFFLERPTAASSAGSNGGLLLSAARNANVLIVATDGRVERRTTTVGWAGSFHREAAIGPPSQGGATIVVNGGDVVLDGPDGTVSLPPGAGSGTVSLDGSTVAIPSGDQIRIGPVGDIAAGTTLSLGTDRRFGGTLAISDDGTRLAAVVDGPGARRQIVVLDARSGDVLGSFDLVSRYGNAPFDVAILDLRVSRDVVAYHFLDDDVRSFLQTEAIEMRRFDGDIVASVSEPFDDSNGPAQVIDRDTPMWLTPGPDGHLLVAELSGRVTRYPVSGEAPVEVLDLGRIDRASAIAIEAAGTGLLAVGYRSGRVELWDLDAGLLLAELSQHALPVAHVVIGQVGNELRVTSTSEARFVGSDVVVRVLNDPDALRATLCDIADRDLTAAEWGRFVGGGDPLECGRGLP